ncbi:hypothetical protein NPX13_g4798 [Xylaria arbuscula]|uniref:Uncharacterized protein n=1 Tax=Xylaria arbuscula TaxID=114810 RepID=A0A9W8TLL0_9PEZI|nr:hypothetical protein NPX13_g4798 [Xylaria arbuscula]
MPATTTRVAVASKFSTSRRAPRRIAVSPCVDRCTAFACEWPSSGRDEKDAEQGRFPKTPVLPESVLKPG